jgi:hypothetical protein
MLYIFFVCNLFVYVDNWMGWCFHRYLCSWVVSVYHIVTGVRRRSWTSLSHCFLNFSCLYLCKPAILDSGRDSANTVRILCLRSRSFLVCVRMLLIPISVIRTYIDAFRTLRSVTSGSFTCVSRRNKIIRNYCDTADFCKNVNATGRCI